MKKAKLMLGDNIQSLKKLPDNSIDSVVSDPPYGLSFMGKKWDYDVPSVEFWQEVFRVLKPGGHILSFGGTRTYHRMVVNIEDAGFEIRDQIQWLYGSGFPKSLNVGKAVDKLEGNERELVGISKNQRLTNADQVIEQFNSLKGELLDTKGQSEWEGWGSALKPANEPICLARKPLSEKSIADNVLKWKTGGINVDGCRIGFNDDDTYSKIEGGVVEGKKAGQYGNYDQRVNGSTAESPIGYKHKIMVKNNEGRFPANLILDESAAEMLDEQSGNTKSNDHKSIGKDTNTKFGQIKTSKRETCYSDKGGASRFFYVAKVSKAERNMGLDGFEEKQTAVSDYHAKDYKGAQGKFQAANAPAKNHHPTVKPVNLMSYLCKLITPPNGIVLDPFMGSGSTGIAALLNDFRFVGMEMDNDYFKIAESRINSYEDYRKFLKK